MLLQELTIQKFRLSYSHKNIIESYKVSRKNLFEKNKIPASELSKKKNPTINCEKNL